MTSRRRPALLVLALALSPTAPAVGQEPEAVPPAVLEYGPPDPRSAAQAVSAQIFFPKSSAYLRRAEREKIAVVAGALARLPGQTLNIHGLTDPYGDPDFNDWLRNERSNAVRDTLVDAGIEPSRLRLADPLPSAAGGIRQPSHKLRRVEFSLEGLVGVLDLEGDEGDKDKVEVAAPEADGQAPVAAGAPDEHGPPYIGALAFVEQTQIYFPKSSAYLRSAEVEKLRQLAGALARLPGQVLSVRGLTDSRGDPNFNNWLRDERAGAVKKRLAALGVPAARMVDGAPRATSPDSPQESREKQRRVEFGIVGLHAGEGTSAGAGEEEVVPGVPPPVAVRRPPRFAEIGRSGRYRLAEVIAIADATRVHFEFAGFRVRREYDRELWSLASAILDTDDGAVSLQAYAAHGLPAVERDEVGKRRALSVAATLRQMGVEWQRIRIEDEVGVSSPDDRPSWRDHRIEFTAIRTLPPEDLPALASGGAAGDATGAELDATVAGSDDPLATLAADTVIYFGGNSAKVRLSDKKKLRRIAEYAKRDGEARTVAVTAVTDRWGNADYNRALGQRRQAAVLNLLHEAGLPPERAVEGEIETTPENDRSPSWQQRRAELRLR